MHFLYPAFPFQLGIIEDTFAEEAEAIKAAGFAVSTVSVEDLEQGTFKIRPSLSENSTIVYRGWMLDTKVYQTLMEGIKSKGCRPITDLETYLSCHHIPNWYSLISDLTPKTKFFSMENNLEEELQGLGWNAYFIKDYVKSLKTSVGSIITDPSMISTVVAEMQKFRGTIEGGLSVRQVEPIIRESERRYFVVDGKVFAADGDPPEIALECARRITSRFFSIDVVMRNDGISRIIEVGDGQVSDSVGWRPDRFAEVLQQVWGDCL